MHEVTSLEKTPNGMIGFTVPAMQYIKYRSTGENPYEIINSCLKENNKVLNSKGVSLEVFYFGEEESKFNANIFVPITGKTVE